MYFQFALGNILVYRVFLLKINCSRYCQLSVSLRRGIPKHRVFSVPSLPFLPTSIRVFHWSSNPSADDPWGSLPLGINWTL